MVSRRLSRRVSRAIRLFPGRAHIALFSLSLSVGALFVLAVFGGLVAYAVRSPAFGFFGDPEFRFAVGFTLRATVAATLCAGLSSLGAAYVLAFYDFPGKRAVEIVLGLPMLVPPLVNGVALLIFFGPIAGPTLSRLGFPVAFNPAAAVIAMWFVASPFSIRMFRQAFASADARYSSLAGTFGLSPLARFFRVQLPLARNGLASGLAMTWARTTGEFGATAMVAGVTRLKTETLSAAIFLSMSGGDLDAAISASLVLLAVSAVAYAAIGLAGEATRVA